MPRPSRRPYGGFAPSPLRRREHPFHEGRALVERLEAGDVGRERRPVGVRPGRHERAAPVEGVGEVLERGGVEPGEVDLGEALSAVEGVLHLACAAEDPHHCHTGDFLVPVEPIASVYEFLGCGVHHSFHCSVGAAAAARRLVADAVGVVADAVMGHQTHSAYAICYIESPAPSERHALGPPRPVCVPSGRLAVALLTLGFPLDGMPNAVFNTRIESALEQLRLGRRGMWAKAIAEGRCLVPACAFYEGHMTKKVDSERTGRLVWRQYLFRLPGARAFLLTAVRAREVGSQSSSPGRMRALRRSTTACRS